MSKNRLSLEKLPIQMEGSWVGLWQESSKDIEGQDLILLIFILTEWFASWFFLNALCHLLWTLSFNRAVSRTFVIIRKNKSPDLTEIINPTKWVEGHYPNSPSWIKQALFSVRQGHFPSKAGFEKIVSNMEDGAYINPQTARLWDFQGFLLWRNLTEHFKIIC